MEASGPRTGTPRPAWAWARPRTWLVAAALAVGAAYSWWAAGSAPFTAGADAFVAVAFAVMAAAMVRTVLRRRRQGLARLPAALAPGGSIGVWAAALGLLVAWELATYFAGFSAGRHAFPTLSSLTDEAFRWHWAKAASFAAWLGLGWGLVRR